MVVAALAVTAALAGCGGNLRDRTSAPPGDRVTVRLWPHGVHGQALEREVTCDDLATCRRLRAADLAPVRKGIACTQIYGGPAVARVQGRVNSRPVDATFSLVDGCQIARWKRLAWLLGPPPTTFKGP
jgi:hypothetical protein